MKLSSKAKLGIFAASTAQAYVYPDCSAGKLASNKVCDPTVHRAERAAALIEAMTSQEKLDNLLRYGRSFIQC